MRSYPVTRVAIARTIVAMWIPVWTALAIAGGPSATEVEEGLPASAHRAYAEVLSAHVKDGLVDYRGLEARSLGALDRYLAEVAQARLPSGREARIGFLMDAYNALVLRSVIRHGRPRSVLDVKGFFDGETHRVAGRELTLDALEKEVLNPFARDPRTHFVLVCGAVGCPILEGQPYAHSSIDARLEAAARRYLASPAGARVRAGELALSKIFDWYSKDFGGKDGVVDFVVPRLREKNRTLVGKSPSVRFFDYNWSLNQQ